MLFIRNETRMLGSNHKQEWTLVLKIEKLSFDFIQCSHQILNQYSTAFLWNISVIISVIIKPSSHGSSVLYLQLKAWIEQWLSSLDQEGISSRHPWAPAALAACELASTILRGFTKIPQLHEPISWNKFLSLSLSLNRIYIFCWFSLVLFLWKTLAFFSNI